MFADLNFNLDPVVPSSAGGSATTAADARPSAPIITNIVAGASAITAYWNPAEHADAYDLRIEQPDTSLGFRQRVLEDIEDLQAELGGLVPNSRCLVSARSRSYALDYVSPYSLRSETSTLSAPAASFSTTTVAGGLHSDGQVVFGGQLIDGHLARVEVLAFGDALDGVRVRAVGSSAWLDATRLAFAPVAGGPTHLTEGAPCLRADASTLEDGVLRVHDCSMLGANTEAGDDVEVSLELGANAHVAFALFA